MGVVPDLQREVDEMRRLGFLWDEAGGPSAPIPAHSYYPQSIIG